jgi:hypothetical protein
MNALHLFGATLRGYRDMVEFHAIRNAIGTLMPASLAPVDMPRS